MGSAGGSSADSSRRTSGALPAARRFGQDGKMVRVEEDHGLAARFDWCLRAFRWRPLRRSASLSFIASTIKVLHVSIIGEYADGPTPALAASGARLGFQLRELAFQNGNSLFE
jgi:hypothetical protein